MYIRGVVTGAVMALAPVANAQEIAGTDKPEDVAQAQHSQGIGEIVVTARRRAESLLNVPVAITPLSAEAIERAHVTNLSQIAEMTPNLLLVPMSGGVGAAMAIRGVGTQGDPGLEQSVGVNIDGISIGRGRIVLASQFDIQQVEVLKGPQALFFGKNSPAGVISIATAGPTKELAAMGRIGYEFESNERYAEAFVSGPITETLAARLAGKYSKMDGWIKNTTVGGVANLAFPGFTVPGPAFDKGPGETSYSGRLTVEWKPSADFTANFKFMANKLEGNGGDAREPFCAGPALLVGRPQTTSLTTGQVVTDQQGDCKVNQRAAVGAIPTPFLANWPAAQKKNGRMWNEQKVYLGSLNLTYNFADLTLTSTTGYAKLSAESLNNADLTSFAIVLANDAERSRSWSQELRLASDYEGPLNFTLGAFFEDAKRTNTSNPYLGFAGFDPANGGSMYTFRGMWKNSGNTYSTFGQLRWAVLDNLELAGGVRYTKEKKSAIGRNLYLNPLGVAFGLAPAGAVVAQNTEFSNWSPEATVSYKPSDNVMAYVAYKTGYKSGGLSTPATMSTIYVTNPGLLVFGPERARGFEAGIKGRAFDRAVRFDLSIYRYTISDLQLTSFNQALIASFTANAGKARTTGFEGSMVWKPTRELELNTGLSYNDAKYVSFVGAQCYQEIYGTPACPGGARGSYDRSGQPLPRAPKWTFNAGANYETDVGSNLKIGLSGDVNYSSSVWTSDTGSPAGIQEAYWRLNANVRIGSADDRWQVALIGRNLTNEYYMVVSQNKALSPAGHYHAFTARPRQIALQATTRF